MTNSDNKLILIRTPENKAEIRYKKSDNSHWATLELEETDIDCIIEQIINKLKVVPKSKSFLKKAIIRKGTL